MPELEAAVAALARLRDQGVRIAAEPEGKRLLAALGIQTPEGGVATTAAEAVSLARRVGLPVAVKLVAHGIAHKSDIGGVAGPLSSFGEVEQAAMRMARSTGSAGRALLVERWEATRIQCLAGFLVHERFGPLVTFGLGGVWVEVLGDVAYRLAPVSAPEALDMITALRAAPVIEGARGRAGADLKLLAEAITRIGDLARDPAMCGLVEELDVNPVGVTEDGTPIALDCTVLLKPVTPAASTAPRHASVRKGAPPVNDSRAVAGIARLLDPARVAVIGASNDERKPGHQLLRNIQDGGYDGEIIPINPRQETILGLRCYPSIAQAPDDVDVAFVVLGRERVAEAVAQCAEQRVGAVVIVTAGFQEADEWGRSVQEEIARVLAGSATVAIGPNTIGYVSMGRRLLGSFAPFDEWDDGPVAIVAQTGVYAGAVASELMKRESQRLGIGVSVDIGNRIDLDETDFLDALAAREGIGVIGFHIEDFTQARRFLARAAEVKKAMPIVVLKPGVTPQGAEASASHTGALATDDRLVAQLLDQHGIIRATDEQDFLAFLTSFARAPLPAGRRVGIVTYSGALGVIATDRVVQHGLELAELSPETVAAVSDVVVGWQTVRNPVDLWTGVEIDPERSFRVGLSSVMADPGVDQVLAILFATPNAAFEGLAAAFAELRTAHPEKPLHAVFVGELGPQWSKGIEGCQIPVHATVDLAARALSATARYAEQRDRMPAAHA